MREKLTTLVKNMKDRRKIERDLQKQAWQENDHDVYNEHSAAINILDWVIREANEILGEKQ
jgi:hypothetical protein